MKLKPIIGLAWLLCVSTRVFAIHYDVVGALPGEAEVNMSGGAVYRLPITPPQGVNGLTPSLSLVYNSQKKNGLLGPGWSLNGPSAISRCATNLTVDGIIDGVDFDDNDQFCLDGKRLVAINGEYGANGTEYRTEFDEYLKVISYGQQGNGPAYFKVWYKNGRIAEYGNSDNAALMITSTSNPAIYRWSVNKIEDRYGNSLAYDYLMIEGKGEQHLQTVTYSDVTIEFNYIDRVSPVLQYRSGGEVSLTKKMDRITIKSRGVEQLYKLTYLIGFDIIKNIALCDGKNKCIATRFVYSKNHQVDSPKPYYTVASTGEKDLGIVRGDFNGDGIQDFIQRSTASRTRNKTATLFLSNGWKGEEAYFKHTVPDSFQLNGKETVVTSGDFNGDGLTDFIRQKPNKRGDEIIAHLYQSQGNSKFTEVALPNDYNLVGKKANLITGDFNGDGRTDFVRQAESKDTAILFLSDGQGDFTQQPLDKAFGLKGDSLNLLTGDFNGDGLTDLIGQEKKYRDNDNWRTARLYLAQPTGGFTERVLPENYAMKGDKTYIIPGDYNGDGLTDFIRQHKKRANADVFFSKGDGDFTKISLPSSFALSGNDGRLIPGDYNSDGMTDFIRQKWHGNQSADTALFVSKGNGEFTEHELTGFSFKGKDHTLLTGDFNGDGTTDLLQQSQLTSQSSQIYTFKDLYQRVEKLTDGLGRVTDFSYGVLTNRNVYTRGAGSEYPVREAQPATHVVERLMHDDGKGDFVRTYYDYEGLRIHATGFGSLGFAKVTTTDQDTKLKTVTHYAQDVVNRKIGLVTRQEVHSNTKKLIKKNTNTWKVSTLTDGNVPRYQVHRVEEQAIENALLTGEHKSTITKQYEYDQYGNPTLTTMQAADRGPNLTQTVTQHYQNDEAQWLLGLLTETADQRKSTGSKLTTRTTQYEYDQTTGSLLITTQEPQDQALATTTRLEYDSWGNVIKTTQESADITPTVLESKTYDTTGRFAITVANGLNHQTHFQYHPIFGVVTQTTDPNGLVTQFSYDAFGRLMKETRPDKTTTTVAYNACESACPENASYQQVKQTSGAPIEKQYFDALNRVIRTETVGPKGKAIYVDTVYSRLGKVWRQSRPYFAGNDPQWDRYEYDVLRRQVKHTAPDGEISRNAYGGLIEVIINAKGRSRRVKRNALGQVVTSLETGYKVTRYHYDAFGNLALVVDPENNYIFTRYDDRGRKVYMRDPDKGEWHYQYNGLDQLIEQRDAKGQVTQFRYDAIGRVIEKINNAQAPEAEQITTRWEYDQQLKGTVSKVIHPQVTQQYTYDTQGRLISTTQRQFGRTFINTQSYDAYGRPLVTELPGRVKIQNLYSETGYQTALVNPATNQPYWTLEETNASGQPIQYGLGNGIQNLQYFNEATGLLEDMVAHIGNIQQIEDMHFSYDNLRNLTRREDKRQGIVETFEYDELNRLNQVTTQQDERNDMVSVQYNDLGNITYKSDVGSYRYGGKCNGRQAGPHAVTSTSGKQNASYCYDVNGNMTSGNGRTIRYSSFDKPEFISYRDSQTQIIYGIDDQRIRRIDEGANGRVVTDYLGKQYERIDTNGVVSHKYYIGDIAVVTKTAGKADTTHYFHKDHLGSLIAITDQNAEVVERFSFDPWGKRRLTNWQSTSDYWDLGSTITTKGFTGHEMLDGVGLIHMNGRVYDPNLGRFLSADPIIQEPYNLQSLNRYSYVLNNPLNLVDPTGFVFEGLFGGSREYNDTGYSCSPGSSSSYNYFGGSSSSSFSDYGSGIDYGYSNVNYSGYDETVSQSFTPPLGLSIPEPIDYSPVHASLLAQQPSWSPIVGNPVLGGLKSILNDFTFGIWENTSIRSLQMSIQTQADIAAYNEQFGMSSTLFGIAGIFRNPGKIFTKSVDPNAIRFSQSSVNGAGDLTKSMQVNGWKGDAIDVVKMGDGGLTTIDNTRVLAASRAGVNVQANIRNASDALPANMVERFTTKKGVPTTWGEAVQLRIGKQNSGFRNTYPNGSHYIGSVD